MKQFIVITLGLVITLSLFGCAFKSMQSTEQDLQSIIMSLNNNH